MGHIHTKYKQSGNNPIYFKIEYARIDANLSRTELAGLLSTTPTTLYRKINNGKLKYQTYCNIAKILHFTPDILPPLQLPDSIYEEHLNKIIDVVQSIKPHQLTILVGNNGTGKSLIRKQLNVRFAKEFNERRMFVREVSMQCRTENRSEYGALSSSLHDDPTAPTSLCTYDLLTSAFDHDFDQSHPYYLCIDELELGLSQESLTGILNYVENHLPKWLDQTLGVMIITHSRSVTEVLLKHHPDADFIWLDYNKVSHNYEEYKNRTIYPMDFGWLREWSSRLYETASRRAKNKQI